MLSLLVTNSLAGYRILFWKWFSFRFLKVLFHCLQGPQVAVEKLKVILHPDPLHVTCLSSLSESLKNPLFFLIKCIGMGVIFIHCRVYSVGLLVCIRPSHLGNIFYFCFLFLDLGHFLHDFLASVFSVLSVSPCLKNCNCWTGLPCFHGFSLSPAFCLFALFCVCVRFPQIFI